MKCERGNTCICRSVASILLLYKRNKICKMIMQCLFDWLYQLFWSCRILWENNYVFLMICDVISMIKNLTSTYRNCWNNFICEHRVSIIIVISENIKNLTAVLPAKRLWRSCLRFYRWFSINLTTLFDGNVELFLLR